MKIIFFCPSVSVINGGIRHIFHMAEALIELGHDAAVFEQNGLRPHWFSSTAPIVSQGIFSADARHLYVLPEDQPKILADFAKLPQRKVIYSQNHFYGAVGIGAAQSYADYGISSIICSSRTIYEHCCKRHPTIPAHVVPCFVDRAKFAPASAKKDVIAFMPRKRPIEAVYIKDMFQFLYPQFRNWAWREISNVPADEVARLLSDARVFLSLSRLEGLGLAPLEAMAAGCVIAGFTGIGGREYANAKNGFWVQEDDFPSCVSALSDAVTLASQPGHDQSEVQETLKNYSREAFTEGVRRTWASILSTPD